MASARTTFVLWPSIDADQPGNHAWLITSSAGRVPSTVRSTVLAFHLMCVTLPAKPFAFIDEHGSQLPSIRAERRGSKGTRPTAALAACLELTRRIFPMRNAAGNRGA